MIYKKAFGNLKLNNLRDYGITGKIYIMTYVFFFLLVIQNIFVAQFVLIFKDREDR